MLNFIKDNRFALFLDKLTIVSRYQTDLSYVDISPNGVFNGDIGTVLVKNGSDILYKSNDTTDFVNLSALFPYVVRPRKYLLERGINKKVTWIKNSSSEKKNWKFLGYTCPFDSTCVQCMPSYYYYA